MRRISTPVDAESIYTTVNEPREAQTPHLHHKDLAEACLRTLSCDKAGLSLLRLPASDIDGGVNQSSGDPLPRAVPAGDGQKREEWKSWKILKASGSKCSGR